MKILTTYNRYDTMWMRIADLMGDVVVANLKRNWGDYAQDCADLLQELKRMSNEPPTKHTTKCFRWVCTDQATYLFNVDEQDEFTSLNDKDDYERVIGRNEYEEYAIVLVKTGSAWCYIFIECSKNLT